MGNLEDRIFELEKIMRRLDATFEMYYGCPNSSHDERRYEACKDELVDALYCTNELCAIVKPSENT
ncbi:hypothetical protein [Methanobacterium sp.]|uniref:hypothetical protein n=1 Tax=Methanobacterium sp. TaxID=2164 RepID=UPI0025FA453C|nr:hypothetical protein [Methanobacterium sp.]MBI5458937.1 hypothetical protein [Methanobacterium sp.]